MNRLNLVLVVTLGLPFPVRAQELIPSPTLAPGVAALPRMAGRDAVSLAINAELEKLDARDLAAINCADGRRSESAGRSVEVLSDGPEFLSLSISAGSYCEGAAHPWWKQSVINFDLRTGKQSDLREYLPAAWVVNARPDEVLSSLFLNVVGELPGECLQTYTRAIAEGYLSFDLGLVENESSLILWPVGLARVEAPCLDVALVSADRLREAGFAPRLIAALADMP